jgi:hypothetical protein
VVIAVQVPKGGLHLRDLPGPVGEETGPLRLLYVGGSPGVLARGPSDPNHLDGSDQGGVACENRP